MTPTESGYYWVTYTAPPGKPPAKHRLLVCVYKGAVSLHGTSAKPISSTLTEWSERIRDPAAVS